MEVRSRGFDTTWLVALTVTALAMGAALAHALELPNKIGLTGDAYFAAQQIYAGWDRLGFLIALELLAQLSLLALYRHERMVALPVAVALAGLLAAQAIFWAFTFPANKATANWTVQPANWEQLRYQWEYSHLAGAACQALSFVALVVAMLARRRF